MSFKHRIVKDDDDRFLNCDEVESLDNLDCIADQLKADSNHLATQFPATPDGLGVAARPVCADVTDNIALSGDSHVQRQMELCLSKVELELNRQQQRQNRVRGVMKGLTAGVAMILLCTVGIFGFGIFSDQWLQNPQIETPSSFRVSATAVPSLSTEIVKAPSLKKIDDVAVTATAREIPKAAELKLTPVSFELPTQFFDASGPEMEGLLDLYESESAEAVTIEF